MKNQNSKQARCIGFVWTAVLAACLMAVCWNFTGTAAPQQSTTATAIGIAPLPQFISSSRVVLYDSDTSEWNLTTFSQAKPANEIYYNGWLYRVINSGKLEFILQTDPGRLFEADRAFDKTSRRPTPNDIVSVRHKDTQFVTHELFSNVQPDTNIRFQGKTFVLKADRKLIDLGIDNSIMIGSLQHIEVTNSSWQHIMARHTVNGSQNAGASVFYPGEDIKALIKLAELITPTQESNGYYSRDCDAGHSIGYDGARYPKTTSFKVIATQSGKLVTAYPTK